MTVLVSRLDIGPISTHPYDFTAQRSSAPTAKGIRSVTFAGTLERVLADQIDALVDNPAAQQTIGGVTGVLVNVIPESAALVNYTGYYLLLTFSSAPDGIRPSWAYSSFTLQAALLGDLGLTIDGGDPGVTGPGVIDGGTP